MLDPQSGRHYSTAAAADASSSSNGGGPGGVVSVASFPINSSNPALGLRRRGSLGLEKSAQILASEQADLEKVKFYFCVLYNIYVVESSIVLA